ncbi:MAG: TonB family protein [Verrucomicrobiota bacterium]
MTEFRQVVVAFALSVLAHVSLFAALALMPVAAPVPAKPEAEEKPPLEVTVEAAPAEAMEEPEPLLPDHLAPENLKKADKAPEKPKILAGHDSEATPPLPDYTATLEAAATPAPLPSPKVEEVGIDALGDYGKAVANAIGVRWDLYRKHLPVGEVRIRCFIDAEGQVSEIKVLSNSATSANAAMAMRAVKEARIPPIPSERLAQVSGGRIEITYSFINYPTP